MCAAEAFVNLWVGTACTLTVSNVLTSGWVLKSESYSKPTALPVRIAVSGVKSVCLGCPLIFVPNMIIRAALASWNMDFKYFIPHFFYEASRNYKYARYTYNVSDLFDCM